MFQQLIFNEHVQPFEQNLANSFASRLLQDRHSQSFSFDHKKQKNKLCFGELMEKPRDISRNQKALMLYTDDYFRGIKDSDYGHAVSRMTFYRQKVSSIQEIDPLYSDKKNIFQEKELPKITIEQIAQTTCQKCQSQSGTSYYEIDRVYHYQNIQIKRDMCEDCALYDYSDQLTKYKLGRIQAKRESKGVKYELKLQNFYDKTLKELKYQNIVVLNAKIVDQQLNFN